MRGDRARTEVREETESEAVGDAFAELAQVPVLDPVEDEGTEDAGGGHPVSACGRTLESADEVLMDFVHKLPLRFEEVGDGPEGVVEGDALGAKLGISEGELWVGGAACHFTQYMVV